MATVFVRQNKGWNADPNAPREYVATVGQTVVLNFHPNAFLFLEFNQAEVLSLAFSGCRKYRITAVNDHAWFVGQCRFSGKAPKWGEFYEVIGDFEAARDPTPWLNQKTDCQSGRQFLFYLRDSTFEAVASKWRLLRGDHILVDDRQR